MITIICVTLLLFAAIIAVACVKVAGMICRAAVVLHETSLEAVKEATAAQQDLIEEQNNMILHTKNYSYVSDKKDEKFIEESNRLIASGMDLYTNEFEEEYAVLNDDIEEEYPADNDGNYKELFNIVKHLPGGGE